MCEGEFKSGGKAKRKTCPILAALSLYAICFCLYLDWATRPIGNHANMKSTMFALRVIWVGYNEDWAFPTSPFDTRV